VTDFGGEEQDLDQAEAAGDGPLRPWTTPAQPGTKYLVDGALERFGHAVREKTP
jgi:hypothetical protein